MMQHPRRKASNVTDASNLGECLVIQFKPEEV